MLWKRFTVAAAIALVATFAAAARPAAAQFSPVALDYVAPTGVDPVDLTFNFIGDTHTVTGNDLLPASFSGNGGANFHAGTTFGQLSITQFTLTFDYTGGLSFIPTAGFGFNPWSTPNGTVSPPGPAVFDIQPGSAPVGQAPDNNHYFALLRFDSDANGLLTSGDIEAFRTSTVTITATAGSLTTPEPGAAALALAPLAAGLLMLRRRGRSSVRRSA